MSVKVEISIHATSFVQPVVHVIVLLG
jgi:hypothetical protein